MVIHKRFYILVIICLASLIAWLITTDILLLSIFLIFLLTLVSSFILSKMALNKVKVNRISHSVKLEVGQIFNERIEIYNESRTGKLWVQIEDRSRILSKIQSRTITNLSPGKNRSYFSQALINKRGYFPLGPTRLISGDPLGIFTVQKEFPAEKQLTVYPYIVHLSNLAFQPGMEAGGQNQLIQSTQTTPQAAGVREYHPGDPLNRIHWPITVKKNRLMVKEFDEDTQSCIWLFLDAEQGSYPHNETEDPMAFDWKMLPINKKKAYKLPKDSFEYAVSVSASLAQYFLSGGRSVGFTALGRDLVILPAEKGQRQLNKILGKLAVIQNHGSLHIQTLIERQIKNIARGSSLIIITGRDLVDIAQSLELIRRWGLRVQVIRIEGDTFTDRKRKKGRGIPDKSRNLIQIAYGDEISKKLSK